MPRRNRSPNPLHCLLVVLLGLCLLSAPAVAEELDFRVTYRGVFSLGETMPIADVTLHSDVSDGRGTRLTRLTASSAAYPFVESLYPIRYRFSTWAELQSGYLVALETYEKTRKEKHRLYLRDGSATGMRRVDLAQVRDPAPATRVAAVDPQQVAAMAPLFDRLGLLAHLRGQALDAGERLVLAVTNGRDVMRYRVKVEKAAEVHVGGVVVPAWKLRLDASETDEQGRQVAAHRAAYVWLSRDSLRLPLRIDVRHAIGRFRAELTTPQALQRVALVD